MGMVKKVLKGLGKLVALVAVGVGCYVGFHAHAFDVSMARVYAVPLPAVARSTDPAVVERGRHLAHSVAGCALSDCHGHDLGGGRSLDIGPLGTFTAPNLTFMAMAYSDAELARLILHGVRRDGRSLRFMSVQEINWMPDADVAAIVSWVRTMPLVQRPNGPIRVGLLAKVLDRHDMIPVDIARRVDHATRDTAPPPSATAAYGRYVGRLCMGCHGDTFSGGPIPGAPSSMAVPPNLTPHATGLAGWTYDDFVRFGATGIRKNGRRVDAIMPTEALANMDDVERRALWAFLQSLPPRPYGGR